MKKILSACLCIVIALLSFAACAPKEENKEVRVLNLGEYISLGDEDFMDVISEFEKRTGITCEYDGSAENNEALYAKVKPGGVEYDVVITSDYMLERMISEDMLQKLDYNKITNWGNIDEKYKKPAFDPKQEYTVPYTVGMVGLAYNSLYVKKPTSWNSLWDEKNKGKILMYNNNRDTFAIAQSILGYSFNSTDVEEWKFAAQKIKDQKPLRYGFVDDQIFDKMQDNEAWLAPCYAGDFLSMQRVNPDLQFVYPKEGVNSFIDSIAILSNAKNVDAAHKFIDFLLEPDIALENSNYLCYASPNTKVFENPVYTWYQNEFLYPSAEKMPKTEMFENLPREILEVMNSLWDEVKR
ncbi:MAG: spermidine/putrescine ABC transporter substrate-binding protein [Oscillospiraceae bacterium]|jgi:spermidine/putrescine transport system substrate-binding protein|nr:spermidine/putrescine ABC transporter substrate-binding protein [Oscillospiraceae bacterium]